MGCRSDYLEPTRREVELKRAAKLLVFALVQTGQKPTDKMIEEAGNIYPTKDYIPALCGILRAMTPEELDRVVYNGRDATSRDLADWWEEHQKADEAREAKEKAVMEKALEKARILEKLGITEEELRKILD